MSQELRKDSVSGLSDQSTHRPREDDDRLPNNEPFDEGGCSRQDTEAATRRRSNATSRLESETTSVRDYDEDSHQVGRTKEPWDTFHPTGKPGGEHLHHQAEDHEGPQKDSPPGDGYWEEYQQWEQLRNEAHSPGPMPHGVNLFVSINVGPQQDPAPLQQYSSPNQMFTDQSLDANGGYDTKSLPTASADTPIQTTANQGPCGISAAVAALSDGNVAKFDGNAEPASQSPTAATSPPSDPAPESSTLDTKTATATTEVYLTRTGSKDGLKRMSRLLSRDHRTTPQISGDSSYEKARIGTTSSGITQIIAASHPSAGMPAQQVAAEETMRNIAKEMISGQIHPSSVEEKTEKYIPAEPVFSEIPPAPSAPPPPLPLSQRQNSSAERPSATRDQTLDPQGAEVAQTPIATDIAETQVGCMVDHKTTAQIVAKATPQSTGVVKRGAGTNPASSVMTKNNSVQPIQAEEKLISTATTSPQASNALQPRVERSFHEVAPVHERTIDTQAPPEQSQAVSKNLSASTPPGQPLTSTSVSTHQTNLPMDMTQPRALPLTDMSPNENQPLSPPANSAQKRSLSVKVMASSSLRTSATGAENGNVSQMGHLVSQKQPPSRTVSALQDNALPPEPTSQAKPRPLAKSAQSEAGALKVPNSKSTRDVNTVMDSSVPNRTPAPSALNPETRRLSPAGMAEKDDQTSQAPSATTLQSSSRLPPRAPPSKPHPSVVAATRAPIKRPPPEVIPQKTSSPPLLPPASRNINDTNSDSRWKMIPISTSSTSAVTAIDTKPEVKDSRWKLLPPFTNAPPSLQKEVVSDLASNWKLLSPFAPLISAPSPRTASTPRNTRSIGTQTVSTVSTSTQTAAKPNAASSPSPASSLGKGPSTNAANIKARSNLSISTERPPSAPTSIPPPTTPAQSTVLDNSTRPPMRKAAAATGAPTAIRTRPLSTPRTEPTIIAPKPINPTARAVSVGDSLAVPEPTNDNRRASMGSVPARKPSPALPPEIAALVKPSTPKLTPASAAPVATASKHPTQKTAPDPAAPVTAEPKPLAQKRAPIAGGPAAVASKPPAQKTAPTMGGPAASPSKAPAQKAAPAGAPSRPRTPAPPMPDSFKKMPTRKAAPVAVVSS